MNDLLSKYQNLDCIFSVRNIYGALVLSMSDRWVIPFFGPKLEMAISRKISFLEESRSRGIAIYHSSGIEEDKIYSSGFEELDFPILGLWIPIWIQINEKLLCAFVKWFYQWTFSNHLMRCYGLQWVCHFIQLPNMDNWKFFRIE